MFRRRSVAILIGVSALVLISAAFPMMAQEINSPVPYTQPPTAGTWQGTVYFGPENEQLAAPITFIVDANGTIQGQIIFDFQYEGMAENLIELMSTYGCVTTFDALTPDGSPVAGYFMDAEQAVGTFLTTSCYLEGFSDLTFGSLITGVWYAEHVVSNDTVFGVQPTATTETATTDDTTGAASVDEEKLAFGVEVYLDNCSECHGYFGEGGPGVADLTDNKVKRMSDAKLLEIINAGVEGTEMEPWARILIDEEKEAVIVLIRNPEILKERYRN